jgi:hypothetical protein
MKCFTLAVRTTHRRTKACELDATIVVYVHRWPCRRFEDERYTVPLAVSPEPENWRTVLEHAIRFEHARGPPAMHETETVNEGADTAPPLIRAICVCGTRMRHDIPDIWFLELE